MKRSLSKRPITVALLAVLAGALTVGLIVGWGGLNQQNVATILERAGPLGPIAIVVLMMLAVVISPLPSAPIAIAAGAAYGHVLGTGLVLVGALVGAMIAFALARLLGRAFVARWIGPMPDAGLFGSQNFLTWTVFVSRLVPFVSFDLISYAAGMSILRPWRFVLATLAGIVPASFGLAHLGSALSQPASGGVFLPVLALGLLTGVPVIWATWRSWRVTGLSDADGSPTQSTKLSRNL